ncbi:hypothetical protein [Streptomyces sp. NPDC056683]|uniref:HalD/BesD family halogenase n=1 Tax=Streptomyces sp. NPDC056683 TaxID=3345910 RepID=UPI0036C2D9EF
MGQDDVQGISRRLENHFDTADFRELVPTLTKEWQENDFVEISDFLPEDLLLRTREELERLYGARSLRRDILVPSTGNTPRFFSNIDRDTLLASTSVIPTVFNSPALRARLSEITGLEVVPVPYVPEEFISSRMERPGDGHGWHWDDYSLALVWLIQAAPRNAGGSLEFVRGTFWDKANPDVERFLAEGEVERRHPATGSAYLLRTDTSMHRVSPVDEGAERIMVCFSYCTPEELELNISHETMELLHPGNTEAD